MNDLGTRILNVMEQSPLGRMSVHILSKQTNDLGLDLDNITSKDLISLTDQLSIVLPFFLGEDSKDIVVNIRRLGNNGMAVV